MSLKVQWQSKSFVKEMLSVPDVLLLLILPKLSELGKKDYKI